MKIEYLKVKNFLCIGNEPLEIDFNDLKNIVLIQGKNLDFHDDNDDFSSDGDEYHSNGAGKSTVSEAIVYGLYGSTIRKKVTHNDAINNTSRKKLEVEIVFSIGAMRYRIVRTRKPDVLRLWQDGPPWTEENEITRGGQPSTQKQIDALLGMNHKAFVNVVCFGQHNDYNFLECTTAEQRTIAESLLSLEVFKDFCTSAKDEVKGFKAHLKELAAAYEQIVLSEETCTNRILQIGKQQKDWETGCAKEIDESHKQLNQIETELSKTDLGPALIRYEKAQEEISTIKQELLERQDNEKKLESAINQSKSHHHKINEKIHEIRLNIKSVDQELKDAQKERIKCKGEIEKLDKLPTGAKCPHCYGVIDKKHYKHVMQLHRNKLDAIGPKINSLGAKQQVLNLEIDKHTNNMNQVKDLKDVAQHKFNLLVASIQDKRRRVNELTKVQRPDLTSKELVLKEKISQLQKVIQSKSKQLEEGGPYVEILSTTKDELKTIQEKRATQKNKMNDVEAEMPYYEWWVKGFDDIRSFIIERIVPVLNARIAYWMGYLINGKMKVTFDKYLNVTIESNPPTGDPYAYFATCGGERKRINLAISQAFAHVMMLSSGTWPSIVFLDEVSDSIDQRGIRSIYQMICELANEKQVFVITHNIHLRQMLEGVDTINLLRQDGCTTKV